MKSPLVSVVVPLFNKGPWVRRALDSIAAQTLSDFEAIIVDDGSTDSGAEIVKGYPDRRFRLIRQANAGPGAARNRGLKECAGDFVAFLDADDEWLPDYLETSIAGLERFGPEVAATSCSFFYGAGDKSSESMWRARGLSNGTFRIQPDSDTMLVVHSLAFMTPCTTVARLPVVRQWGGFYEANKCRYAEDSFLWLKVLLNETVAFNLSAHVRVHHEAGSLSQNLAGARPVEPFLENAGLIEPACPERLRPLLKRFYALRAFKTACMLGYWGDWRKASELRRRFNMADARRLPYYWRSLMFSTMIGPAAAMTWRALANRTDPPQR